MKKMIFGEIIYNSRITENIFDIKIKNGYICENAGPGQFVNIYIPSADMLLPRPLSICETFIDDGVFRIIYQVVGAGTSYLKNLRKGDQLKILSPLGNGFEIRKTGSAAIIGGGIGTPPLLYLARALTENNKNIRVRRSTHANEALPRDLCAGYPNSARHGVEES